MVYCVVGYGQGNNWIVEEVLIVIEKRQRKGRGWGVFLFSDILRNANLGIAKFRTRKLDSCCVEVRRLLARIILKPLRFSLGVENPCSAKTGVEESEQKLIVE